MLRSIRMGLATLMFIGITWLFIDFTGTAWHWFGWTPKLQAIEAVLALNVFVIAFLVVLTLLFGRIYCSVICPLGILQDVFGWMGKKAKKTVVENVSGMKKRQGESEEEFVNRQIQEDLRQRGVKEYLKPQKGESYKSWRWRQDEFEKATKERDKKHQSYVREHTSMRDVTTPEEARKMMDDEMTNKLQPDQERNRRIERNWDIAYKTTYAAREGSKWALRTISSYSKATGGAHAASVADGGLALIAGAEELGNCINEGETVVKTIARTAIKGGAGYGKSKINSTQVLRSRLLILQRVSFRMASMKSSLISEVNQNHSGLMQACKLAIFK